MCAYQCGNPSNDEYIVEGEIVHCSSQEFSDVCEIYRLRRNTMERLLHNVD
jgi:hypothetical protein